MTVYIVSFKTTGQVWHTAVCANRKAVKSVLDSHGITVLAWKNELYSDYVSAHDKSQTATVTSVTLIER